MTELYIGTKLINAVLMTRQEYNDFRGWELPADEDGADEGYLVEYLDGGKANTEAYAGYVSWSPLTVFEQAYKPAGNWGFGQALEMLKLGKKLQRAGWNGKGMYLFHVTGNCWDFTTCVSGVDNLETAPFICMKTANDELVPWLASQTDILASDWQVAE